MLISDNSLAPIVLFVYRRPEVAIQSLEAISRNYLADQSTLYIYADGPKENADEDILQEIKETRHIIRKKKWTKEVIIIESEKNKGLANSVISGITEVINKHGKAIVLDDDQFISKGFLKYMNKALGLFEKEEQVMQISGYVFPFANPVSSSNSAYFIPLAASTAWATWKRAWDKFDRNAEGYKNLLLDKDLSNRFDVDGIFPYTKIMIDQMQKKEVDSWAIRWWWSVFIHKGFALSPDKSLAQYIPSGNKATHVTGSELPFTHKSFDKNYYIENYPKQIEVDTRYFEEVKKGLAKILYFYTNPKKKFSPKATISKNLKKISGQYAKLRNYSLGKTHSALSKAKRIAKAALLPGKIDMTPEEKEKQRLGVHPRYIPSTTTIFGKEIKLTDAASFLFIYDEIFKKQIYKFNSSNKHPRIIDCGANIGLSIIYFKRLFPGATIIGFEPDPGAFEALRYNIEQFGLENVELKQKGVWDQETTLNFFAEGADGGRVALPSDKEKICEIKTDRLKDYLNTHVDFLKIDIEGSETRVLIDCADNLKNVDRIFVEYHSFADQEQNLQKLLKTLSDAGFRYIIQHIGVVSPTPFIAITTSLNIDNQLNIFAYR